VLMLLLCIIIFIVIGFPGCGYDANTHFTEGQSFCSSGDSNECETSTDYLIKHGYSSEANALLKIYRLKTGKELPIPRQ
jgi:hypothetical protein